MDQKTIKYGSGALFETLLEIMLRFHMCDEEGRLAAEFLCQVWHTYNFVKQFSAVVEANQYVWSLYSIP